MSRLYAAEFVFPGHPDKLCDAIADSLVQEAADAHAEGVSSVLLFGIPSEKDV